MDLRRRPAEIGLISAGRVNQHKLVFSKAALPGFSDLLIPGPAALFVSGYAGHVQVSRRLDRSAHQGHG